MQPWPEIRPPVGWMNDVRMPLARVTGMCSLSACRAVLVRSSGWNCAASATSWVSFRLPISASPTVEPASTSPGQRSRPPRSMVWASGGIRTEPAGPTAAILPSATTTVPPWMSGPATGWIWAPTSAKTPLG